MSIQSKTLFYHTLSSRGFKSEGAAKRDYNKIVETKRIASEVHSKKEEYANYCRLNATSSEHFKELLEVKAKEFWGIELKFTKWHFSYSKVSNTHSSPIGKPTNFSRVKGVPEYYMGFSGKCEGTCIFPNRIYQGIHDLARNNVNGFNVLCGAVGRDFDCQVNLFIDDFPLIAAKHEEYLEYRSNYLKEKQKADIIHSKNNNVCNEVQAKDPTAIEMLSQIKVLKDQADNAYKVYLARLETLRKENSETFEHKYPREKCKHLDVFGNLIY